MNTRVKVPRTTLIERVKAAIAEEQAKSDEEQRKYKEKVAKTREAFKGVFSSLASQISSMSDAELDEFIIQNLHSSYYGTHVQINLKRLPSAPQKYDPSYDERMLRILEASTDDTISVSTRDGLYQYL